MELSTSIPTPRASPPRLMMLRDTSNTSMRTKVSTTEMGMASATATGYRGCRRKRKRTRNARTPPRTSAETTLSMDSEMKPAWEWATSAVTPGNSPRRSSRTSSTREATSTLLAPDSLKTRRPTASRPLYRARDSRSANPSRTRATFRTRTLRAPPASVRSWPTTTSPISSTRRNSPRVRRGKRVRPSRTVPPGAARFAWSMAVATVPIESPWDSRRSGSTSTTISRSRPPVTRAWATPSSCSRRRRKTVSASSFVSQRSSPATEMTSTGSDSGSTRRI